MAKKFEKIIRKHSNFEAESLVKAIQEASKVYGSEYGHGHQVTAERSHKDGAEFMLSVVLEVLETKENQLGIDRTYGPAKYLRSKFEAKNG